MGMAQHQYTPPESTTCNRQDAPPLGTLGRVEWHRERRAERLRRAASCLTWAATCTLEAETEREERWVESAEFWLASARRELREMKEAQQMAERADS